MFSITRQFNDNIWINLDKLTPQENTRIIKIVKMVRESLDERWSYMHEIKNGIQSIYYDDWMTVEKEVTRYINESDAYYIHHCKQIDYFIDTVLKKKMMPVSVVENFFVLLGLYVPFFNDKIKRDLSDLFEQKYYYAETVTLEDENILFVNVEDGTDVIVMNKKEALDIIFEKP